MESFSFQFANTSVALELLVDQTVTNDTIKFLETEHLYLEWIITNFKNLEN